MGANPPMTGRISGGRSLSSNDVVNIITNIVPAGGGSTGMKTNQFTTNTVGSPIVGDVNFAGSVTITNASNGAGLTNLNATELRSGTLADARLSGTVITNGDVNARSLSNNFTVVGNTTNTGLIRMTAGSGANMSWTTDGAGNIGYQGGGDGVQGRPNSIDVKSSVRVGIQNGFGLTAGTVSMNASADTVNPGNFGVNNIAGAAIGLFGGTGVSTEKTNLSVAAASGIMKLSAQSGFTFNTAASFTNGIASFYSNTPTSITVAGSPVNFTNTTAVNVDVFVDGVSVTGTVAINGTTIFNTIGQNTVPNVEPGDWVTITYTIGTPTAWYR